MNVVKALTPENTEELKPGLFIQQTQKGYRQINPMAWEGRMRWKEQMKTVFSLRTVFTIALVLFLAWSYMNDVGTYKEFYEDVMENQYDYCRGILENGEIMDKTFYRGDDGNTLTIPDNIEALD